MILLGLGAFGIITVSLANGPVKSENWKVAGTVVGSRASDIGIWAGITVAS